MIHRYHFVVFLREKIKSEISVKLVCLKNFVVFLYLRINSALRRLLLYAKTDLYTILEEDVYVDKNKDFSNCLFAELFL